MSMFVDSAATARLHGTQGLSLLEWFRDRQSAHRFRLEQIPFDQLRKWSFHSDTGNLIHDSGRFFSIEGIHARTNWGSVPEWEQPIINQPEIGFLGFITRKMDGVLHFLVQAKMEPGNINMIQLAPTLQATRSNFTRVHEGKTPRYLEYFTDRSRSRVLVDALQSEQGARFLQKRNRNIIIEVQDDVETHEDYCWMTLGEILAALRHDNLVNMDARTVLSCIDYGAGDESNRPAPLKGTSNTMALSFRAGARSAHSNEEIISWFTEQKFNYELNVERIPLNRVRGWIRTKDEIRHEQGKYFSVIACSVEADNREVGSWTQPLVRAHQQGLIAFVVRSINGVPHFLVQAKVEPGNFDIVEMAPTVQCLTGSYESVKPEHRPPFVNYVTTAKPERMLFDTLQSEEGGRFYREANRNLIIEAHDDFPLEVPDNYIWMTARQLKEFIKYNNFVNVQARCLLSCLAPI